MLILHHALVQHDIYLVSSISVIGSILVRSGHHMSSGYILAIFVKAPTMQ